jgi:glycosyltransferase involved in cell wall biosynthesis
MPPPCDTILIFSRDRPMQLACTLETLLREATGLESVLIQVVLRASDGIFLRQYHEVSEQLRDQCRLLFLEEQSFSDDLAACLHLPEPTDGFVPCSGWPGRPVRKIERQPELFARVLFVVDDCIFVGGFDYARLADVLESQPELLGCSLRLGSNCTINYMARCDQQPPPLEPLPDGLVSFRWEAADGDFGYPLEVSSSLYRVSDILPAVQARPANPNLLEAELVRLAPELASRRPRLACLPQSVAFCNPLNLVQQVSDNRAGSDAAHDVRRLSERFAAGERIATADFHSMVPTGCHQELPLRFEKRPQDQETAGQPGLVSVVIPTFNRRDTVSAAVDSVLAQTYAACEVIVVDDGSTDGTSELLRERYIGEPRVQLVWQENAERCAARNRGVELARGEFVAFLDSDDLWLPEKLAKQMRLFTAHPRLDLVHTDFGSCDADGRSYFSEPRPNTPGVLSGNIFFSLLTSDPIGTLTVVARRSAFLERGGFGEDRRLIPFEDWELLTRLAYRSEVGYVPEQLALHRVHAGNTGTPVEPEDYLIFWAHVQTFLRAEDRPQAEAAANRGYWFALIHGQRTGLRLLAELPAAVRFIGIGPLIRLFLRTRRRVLTQAFR